MLRRSFMKFLSIIPFLNFTKRKTIELIEDEPVFEVRECIKPDRSILYNILKSGKKWSEIKDRIWRSGKVKFIKLEKEDLGPIDISSCVKQTHECKQTTGSISTSDPVLFSRALSLSEIQQLADPSNVMLKENTKTIRYTDSNGKVIKEITYNLTRLPDYLLRMEK